MAYKTRFKPKNLSKYIGTKKELVCRSLWERRVCKFLDESINVTKWSFEELEIPYLNPIDKKVHRYFVDFYIKVKDQSNNFKKYLIEIKPEKFTKPPEKPKRMTKKFLDEAFQFGVNEAKWKAAFEFCEDRNMKFMILTEKHLGIKELKK